MRYIFVINLLRNILLGSSYMFWHPRIMIIIIIIIIIIIRFVKCQNVKRLPWR